MKPTHFATTVSAGSPATPGGDETVRTPVATQTGKAATFTGRIVDLAEFLSQSKGPSTHDPAQCIRNGATAGFVVDGLLGEGVYVILEDPVFGPSAATDLARYAGREVEITGRTFDRSGMEAILIVSITDSKDDVPAPNAES
jgi:hypothetical protein